MAGELAHDITLVSGARQSDSPFIYVAMESPHESWQAPVTVTTMVTVTVITPRPTVSPVPRLIYFVTGGLYLSSPATFSPIPHPPTVSWFSVSTDLVSLCLSSCK